MSKQGFEVSLVAQCDEDMMVDGVQIRALSKPKNRKERVTKTIPQLFRLATRERADVYHFHDPELIPVGMLLKLRGKRVVYDVHEDLPRQVLSKEWIPKSLRPLVSRVVEWTENFAIQWFDGVVAATDPISERFPTLKSIALRNYPIVQDGFDYLRHPYRQRRLVLAYIGSISRIRGINEMLQAFSALPADRGARLTLVGRFSPSGLEEEVKRSPSWQHVEFHGWKTSSETKELLSQSKAGLVCFHPEPNHIDAQPNKLFEYMQAGLPVIVSDFPRWREFIAQHQCGLVVDPLDPSAVAHAITWILDHPEEAEAMGQRGREAILQAYSWESESEKLLALYQRILKP